MAFWTATVAVPLWALAVPSLGVCSVIFAEQVEYDVGSFPHGVAIGDINGDEFLDIVVANVLTEDVSVLHSQQDGTFAPESRFAAGGDARLVELGDLDQDLDMDVVVGLQSSPNVFAVLRNTGAEDLSAPHFYGSMIFWLPGFRIFEPR
jgi:FG-GAP-like repeat